MEVSAGVEHTRVVFESILLVRLLQLLLCRSGRKLSAVLDDSAKPLHGGALPQGRRRV